MKKNILKFHYVYYLKSSFCRQKFWKRVLFFNIILKTALSFIFIPKPINTSLWLHVNYTVISFANSISTFRWTWQKSYYITLKWFHSMFRWCVWTKLKPTLWKMLGERTMPSYQWNMHEWLWERLPRVKLHRRSALTSVHNLFTSIFLRVIWTSIPCLIK